MEREQLNIYMHKLALKLLDYPFKVWGYGEALGLEGLLAAWQSSGDRTYLDFVHHLVKGWVMERPWIDPIDHTAPGRVLLDLYIETRDSRFLDQAYRLAQYYKNLPRARNGAGLHRPDHPEFKNYVYVDCMELDGPFLCRLGRVTGEKIFIELGVDLLLSHARALRDAETGLYYPLYDDAKERNNGAFWGRGNGWALLGLMGVLEELDPNQETYTLVQQLIAKQIETLVRLQDKSGHWHTVLDHPETYLESSLAAFFCFAITQSIRKGWIPLSHQSAAQRAWSALSSRFEESGMIAGVSYATPPGDVEQYNHAPTGGLYPWGHGPALLAAVSLLQEPNGAILPTGGKSNENYRS